MDGGMSFPLQDAAPQKNHLHKRLSSRFPAPFLWKSSSQSCNIVTTASPITWDPIYTSGHSLLKILTNLSEEEMIGALALPFWLALAGSLVGTGFQEPVLFMISRHSEHALCPHYMHFVRKQGLCSPSLTAQLWSSWGYSPWFHSDHKAPFSDWAPPPWCYTTVVQFPPPQLLRLHQLQLPVTC